MIRKTINTENIQRKEDIKMLIASILKKYPTGGALHIVIDDYNIDDRYILDCMKDVVENKTKTYSKEDIKLFVKCSSLLLQLSYSARLKLLSGL